MDTKKVIKKGSSLFKAFKTNQEAEIEGVWIEYGPNDDGTIPAFKLARISRNNKKYTKMLEKETRPHRRAIELNTMSDEQAEAITTRVFVRSVLLDWRNVQNAEGNTIAFTEQNAVALFNELPDLYDDLNAKARNASLFRDEALEAEAGN